MRTRTWIIAIGVCLVVVGGFTYYFKNSERTYISQDGSVVLSYPASWIIRDEYASQLSRGTVYTFQLASSHLISPPWLIAEIQPNRPPKILFNKNWYDYGDMLKNCGQFNGCSFQIINATKYIRMDETDTTFNKQMDHISLYTTKGTQSYGFLITLDHNNINEQKTIETVINSIRIK